MPDKSSYSKKDIYGKLINIAKKYTDIDDNTDFLKAGLFGYVTESMAMIMKDSSLHKSMLYKESFLNTATMPKSVYNWAKTFNIDINRASPAYADIEIIIPTETLSAMVDKKTMGQYSKKFGLGSSNEKCFIIDRDDSIRVDDYIFNLERSILVKKDDSGVFSAEYIVTENNTTNFQTLINPTLSIFPRGTNHIIRARAFQFKRTKISKQISNNSILQTKVHLYNFTEQFAGISMSYERPGVEETSITCKYSNIDNDENGVFCYYSLNNTDEVQITFSTNKNAFLPKGNDILNAYIYTTLGTAIPSQFTGDAVINLSDDDFKSYPIIVNFNPTNIIGGKDMPSLGKIKNTIVNEISSRNVIITESDLNNYFGILTALIESVNDGKVTFVKKRDDIVKRLFSTYLLLRDGLNDDGEVAESNFISRCIPTNTIDIDFPIAKNTSKSFGTIARKNIVNDEIKYVYANSSEGLDNDYYIIPFYIYISLNPVRKVKYLYNLVDSESTVKYTKSTVSGNAVNGYYMIPTNISLYRGMNGRFAERQYSASFNFTTNFDMAAYCNYTENGSKLTIKKDSSVIMEMALDNNNHEITSVKQKDDDTLYTTTIRAVINVSDNEFDFTSGSTAFINLLNGDQIKPIPEDIVLSLDTKVIANGTTFDFTVEGNQTQSFFQNLDNMLFSSIVTNTEYYTKANTADNTGKNIKSITLKDVPVVHASYFNNGADGKKDKFINQLFTYIKILKENIEKLETNTFFDIKFYNTHGYSYIYDTNTTNLKLELRIHLADEYKNDKIIESQIRSYIRRLVDLTNTTGRLGVSNITGLVDTTYSNYIKYIEFVGLNDTFAQCVEKKPTIDESMQVLEWINIPPDDLNNYITFV